MTAGARQIVEALAFAARAHAGQKRDDMGDPYINHLAEVALSSSRHEPFDPVLVTAALLHDTIEDTPVTADDLRRRFGDVVTEVVLEVTDPDGLTRKQKRDHQIRCVSTASDRAKILKIADKTSNVAELADLPGGPWPVSGEDPRDYLQWSRDVVDLCRGLDPQLEADFEAAAARLEAAIAQHEKGKDTR